jgi:hypothetical protein
LGRSARLASKLPLLPPSLVPPASRRFFASTWPWRTEPAHSHRYALRAFSWEPPCFSRESWTSVQRKQAPSSLGFSPGSDRNAPGNTRITDRRCAFYCVTGVSPALRLARVPRSTRSRPTAGVPRAFRRRPDEGRRRNLRFPTRGYRRHLSLIARSFLIENGCRLMQPCYWMRTKLLIIKRLRKSRFQ